MYTELTGVPPFVAAPLSEMYQNIREGRYPEPAHLSPSARRLIARLLAPDPAERPSLDHLLQDDFFTQVGCQWVGPPFSGCLHRPRRGSGLPGSLGIDPQLPTPKGFTLDRLPPHCCHSPPVFTIPPAAGQALPEGGPAAAGPVLATL